MKNKLEAEEVIKLRLVIDENKGLAENKKERALLVLIKSAKETEQVNDTFHKQR